MWGDHVADVILQSDFRVFSHSSGVVSIDQSTNFHVASRINTNDFASDLSTTRFTFAIRFGTYIQIPQRLFCNPLTFPLAPSCGQHTWCCAELMTFS